MINNENLPNKKVGNILLGHLQHPEEVFQNNLFLTLKGLCISESCIERPSRPS